MELDRKLIQQIGKTLIRMEKTLAVAESVTAGNIQAGLSLAKDASKFFQGGITTYNLGQKSRHLLVEPIHALDCNCVSESISEQMAKQVCILFLSDYGIGITGFASIMPEEGINKLYAYICIVANDKVIARKKVTATVKEPYDIQIFYSNAAFKLLNNALKKSQP